MEQTKSFFEFAEEEGSVVSVFEPDYTSEFKSYLEDSIRQSDSANRDSDIFTLVAKKEICDELATVPEHLSGLFLQRWIPL